MNNERYGFELSVLGAVMVRDVAGSCLGWLKITCTDACWSICSTLTLLVGRPVAIVELKDVKGYCTKRCASGKG